MVTNQFTDHFNRILAVDQIIFSAGHSAFNQKISGSSSKNLFKEVVQLGFTDMKVVGK